MVQRLDKFISSQGMRSRRDTVKLIRSGRVTVDGQIVRDPSCKVDDATAAVTVDGTPITYQTFTYLMLNKPAGILCVSRDPKVRTVVDLVPEAYQRKGLFPAGRLDKNTVGLVLLTDDGDFAHRLLAPRKHVEKMYRARLDGPLTEEHIRAFAEGTTLADGTKCLPATVRVIEDTDTPLVEVRIVEGKYHQIKRMFGTVDRGVDWLKRYTMGGLVLDESLKEGECRPISAEELENIFK